MVWGAAAAKSAVNSTYSRIRFEKLKLNKREKHLVNIGVTFREKYIRKFAEYLKFKEKL